MSDVWVTQKGEEIPVESMTEGHLINAWRWVERMINQVDACTAAVYAVAPVDLLEWDWSDEHLYQRLVSLNDRRKMLRKEFKRRALELPGGDPNG